MLDNSKSYYRFWHSFTVFSFSECLRFLRRCPQEYSRCASLVTSGLILPKRSWCWKKGTLLSHRLGKDGKTAPDTPQCTDGCTDGCSCRGQEHAWPPSRQIKMMHRRFHALLAKTSFLPAQNYFRMRNVEAKYCFVRDVPRVLGKATMQHSWSEKSRIEWDSKRLFVIRQLGGHATKTQESRVG